MLALPWKWPIAKEALRRIQGLDDIWPTWPPEWLITHYPFGDFRWDGTVLITLLQQNPAMHGTVFELPQPPYKRVRGSERPYWLRVVT
jgi:hypothetical protein